MVHKDKNEQQQTHAELTLLLEQLTKDEPKK